MTKEEFKGFSSAAQHDMVLDAWYALQRTWKLLKRNRESHS